MSLGREFRFLLFCDNRLAQTCMKKYIIVALVQFIWVTGTIAEEMENPLEVWAAHFQHISSTGHPPVSVTAYLKHSGDKYLLAFKLTNISKRPLTLRPSELPWGNPHSITLAAVTTDGQRVPNHYSIADRPIEKQITITSGTSREGDYDLANIVQPFLAPKDKDIVVLWSYRVPGDFKNPQPICTGVVVITK